MSLGVIPNSPFFFRYKLEDTSDSGGSSKTLTNVNSVPFNTGLFEKGADFGSSGNNKNLFNTSSAFNNTDMSIIVWFKLNNTTSTSGAIARIFRFQSSIPGVFTGYYTISGSNITFYSVIGRATTNSNANITIPVDNKWHMIIFVRSTLEARISIDGVNFITNSGSGAGTTGSLRSEFGNDTANLQIWATLDEIIGRDFISSNSIFNKYYTQSKGRFCI